LHDCRCSERRKGLHLPFDNDDPPLAPPQQGCRPGAALQQVAQSRPWPAPPKQRLMAARRSRDCTLAPL